MSPTIFRTLGLICCVAAAAIFVVNYSGKMQIGSPYTPFFLFAIGALALIRARMTKPQ